MDLLNLDVAREYFGVLLLGLGVTVGLTLSVITMSCVIAIPVALALWLGRAIPGLGIVVPLGELAL